MATLRSIILAPIDVVLLGDCHLHIDGIKAGDQFSAYILGHHPGQDCVPLRYRHGTCHVMVLSATNSCSQNCQAIPAFIVTYAIEDPPSQQSTAEMEALQSTNKKLEAKVDLLKTELEV